MRSDVIAYRAAKADSTPSSARNQITITGLSNAPETPFLFLSRLGGKSGFSFDFQ